jgi:hypothetical protein
MVEGMREWRLQEDCCGGTPDCFWPRAVSMRERELTALGPFRTHGNCKFSGLRRQTGSGFCHQPLVWGLPIKGSVRSMVIVVAEAFPFTPLLRALAQDAVSGS